MIAEQSVSTGALPAFQNEPYVDFSQPAARAAMERALAGVRAQFGREYELWIGGEPARTGAMLVSRNPSNPDETVGVHHKATPELARRAVEDAHAFFAEWSRTPAETRVAMLLRAAAILRERKLEFDAWLVYEAGKTWPEAEADVAEAIDFCEYYAREMAAPRLARRRCTNCPASRIELVYLPLGVGVVIPPWNFPLAILAGMTMAALVAGNTVVVKPSSETPTIAAKFAEVLREAGFPPRSFSLLVGSGAEVGDVLVKHPKTRFVCFHRLARRRAAHQRTGGEAAAGPDLDQARGRGDGRQGRHHRGPRGRSRSAPWTACLRRPSAIRARSARPVRAPSWTMPSTTSFWRS